MQRLQEEEESATMLYDSINREHALQVCGGGSHTADREPGRRCPGGVAGAERRKEQRVRRRLELRAGSQRRGRGRG